MMAVATAAAVTPSARPAAAAEGAAPRGFGAELAAQSASAAVAASASGIAADADAESAVSIEVADAVETEIDIADALNLPTGEGATEPEITPVDVRGQPDAIGWPSVDVVGEPICATDGGDGHRSPLSICRHPVRGRAG